MLWHNAFLEVVFWELIFFAPSGFVCWDAHTCTPSPPPPPPHTHTHTHIYTHTHTHIHKHVNKTSFASLLLVISFRCSWWNQICYCVGTFVVWQCHNQVQGYAWWIRRTNPYEFTIQCKIQLEYRSFFLSPFSICVMHKTTLVDWA